MGQARVNDPGFSGFTAERRFIIAERLFFITVGVICSIAFGGGIVVNDNAKAALKASSPICPGDEASVVDYSGQNIKRVIIKAPEKYCFGPLYIFPSDWKSTMTFRTVGHDPAGMITVWGRDNRRPSQEIQTDGNGILNDIGIAMRFRINRDIVVTRMY